MRSTSESGAEAQRGRDVDSGLDAADRDQLRARDDAACAHLLGVARQAEPLLDLRERDERALALAAEDPLLGLEALQHVADGRPGDAVLGAELALGGQGRARGTRSRISSSSASRRRRDFGCAHLRCARVSARRSLPLSRPPCRTITNLTVPIAICKIAPP